MIGDILGFQGNMRFAADQHVPYVSNKEEIQGITGKSYGATLCTPCPMLTRRVVAFWSICFW